ncbi:MAG: hypothetical protein ACJ76Y_25560 [Thermoanaerobaculia bacterium]
MEQDRKRALKVMKLIESVQRDPFSRQPSCNLLPGGTAAGPPALHSRNASTAEGGPHGSHRFRQERRS